MLDKQCVITEYEICSSLAQFPNIEQWAEASVPDCDILIVALGFEDRSTYVASKLASLQLKNSSQILPLALVAQYGTNKIDNKKNELVLKNSLSTLAKRIEYIDADSPQSVALDLGAHIDLIKTTKPEIKVVFDISAASGNFILAVMHVLLARGEYIHLTILYTEPECYYPNFEEYDRDQENLVSSCCSSGIPDSPHEYGVEGVQVNELYPGYGVENRSELVVAIPSFRTERLRYCLQYVSDQIQADPSKYMHWLLGFPPVEKNRWRHDLQRKIIHRMMANMVGLEVTDASAPKLRDDNCSSISTLNYLEMLKNIIKIADDNVGSKITVIHMGSKMQSIGLSLGLYVRREVALCYSRPSGFNPTRYSSGTSTSWILSFGLLGPKLKELARIGELNFSTSIETARSGLRDLE